MLQRKIYKDLLDWKTKRHTEKLKKCLILKGARQVGKSFIISEFGKNEYKSFISIDFFKNPDLKSIFDGELSSQEIFKRISATIPSVKLIPGNTLIFLDEIQMCGNARTSVKFLAEDMNFDVILSGSLLGLPYKEVDDQSFEIPSSVPVGYETNLIMYSIDFEEFLWAYGYDEQTIDNLKNYVLDNLQIPISTHDKFESLFREFMVVGGMPEVVSDFMKYKDFNRVNKIQEDILSEYQNDISKHAKGIKKKLVRMCYDSIPKQLAKEKKKFQYSIVEKGQTKRKFEGSIKWLEDSGLVNICYNVHEPFIPLMANSNKNQFKLYLNDTGLLSCMYGFETKKALLNNTIKGNARGGLYENIIGECLVKKGYKLYYYKPTDNMEIEFLKEFNGEVLPIEVKAGNNPTPSLNNFIQEFNPSIAYKFISNRNGKKGVKETLPHYMIIFI